LSVCVIAASSAMALPSQRAAVSLPKLPERHDLYPGLYDENNCKPIPADEGGGKRCPQRVVSEAPLVEMPSKQEHEHKQLLGYVGGFYADEISKAEVKLLDETVTTATAGPWEAMGLIRNENVNAVGDVKVTASLYGPGNVLLETASGLVPIANLRSGEPGPFRLATSTDTSLVSRVEWAVSAGHADTKVSRDLIIRQYFQAPYGATETNGTKNPYVLAAGFQNWGKPIDTASITAAWLDQNGRVVWVQSADIAPNTKPGIAKRDMANFQHIEVQAAVGQRLHQSAVMMWGVGQ